MRAGAFDPGDQRYSDAADNLTETVLSEELIAEGIGSSQRDRIVIATKIGYDFRASRKASRRGQREIPQRLFPPEAIRRATDRSFG